MTYEDISRVNGQIKMLDLKGKDYAMVPERVTAFRKLYPEGFITTRIISHEDGVVLMTAEAGYYADNGERVVLGTGFAQEVKGTGMVNKTSYIENCETSAVGRALGFLGLGIDGGGICSAEELANAITAQRQMETKKDAPAHVTKVATVPAAELPPVMTYFKETMDNMREMRGITASENKKIFLAQKDTLVKKKMVPDKRLDQYTMEEAQALVDMMYKCFDTTGTELKTE